MDFKTYLSQQGLSKSSVAMYHYNTLGFISYMDKDNTEMEHVSPKEIMHYLAALQQRGLDTASRKLRLYGLKHFFDYQIAQGLREDNPAKRIKLKARQHQKIYPCFNAQELAALHDNYPLVGEDHPKAHHNWFKGYRLSKLRNRVILSLLIHQGITTAEVSRLQLEDLDLRQGKLHIRGGRILKDRSLDLKATQIIELMDYQSQTREALLDYQKQKNTPYLFLSTPASGATYAQPPGALQIWKTLRDELKAQQPKFIKLQQIRNSVITLWIKQYNLRQVQYRAGHRNIISTEAYQVNDVEGLQAAINQYGLI